MASQNVASILRSKGAPFSERQLDSISDAEGWRWIYANKNSKAKNDQENPEVCFTGFRSDRKRELSALAESLGFKVVRSVTAKLEVLCFGGDPGPSKLEKASERGARILTERSFRELCMPPPDLSGYSIIELTTGADGEIKVTDISHEGEQEEPDRDNP